MKIRYQSRCQVNAVEVADLLRDQEAAGFEHAAHLADLKRLVRVQDDVEAVVCKIQVLVIADKLDIDPFGSQSLKQQPVVPLPPFRHRYQVPGWLKDASRSPPPVPMSSRCISGVRTRRTRSS